MSMTEAGWMPREVAGIDEDRWMNGYKWIHTHVQVV